MSVARACRWAAIAMAVVAIIDPRVPWPDRVRPSVRVVTGADADARRRVGDHLRAAGFPVTTAAEAATIVTADSGVVPALTPAPIYVLDEHASEPDVSIARASAPGVRVPGQSVALVVSVRARGGRGSDTTIHLEDGGLAVASATHRWSADEERWQATLSYRPAGAGPVRLRVRAGVLTGERHTADNVADVLAPAARAPVRTLVIDSGVTWPAVFVRRALEASPGFAVSAVQRTTKTIATRAGAPPHGLARRDVAPYEVVVVGESASLDAGARDALRWFVEERGGVAVLVPDRMPAAGMRELLGDVTFETRTLENPAPLGGMGAGLLAAELSVPRALPPLAFALAPDASGAPIVFGLRRGMGAVIVSGALDAWRYRDRNESAFGRFWPAVLLQQAALVPPTVEVTAAPPLARPDEVVHVTARLRETELSRDGARVAIPAVAARAINPAAHVDEVVRLWPSAEPGVFEGEWRPAVSGEYAVDVSIGASSGAAIVEIAADAVPPASDAESLAIAAAATGGAVADSESALLRALTDRLPAATVTRPAHPARSPWYAAAFALLLCGEWALRRRQGLP